mmetsp:Transcript_35147/g.91975  ORF Transcript_35147/g.91975 Transcript_35147/m.91975 type:complete len:355 (+) Transcript_35147:272-1336(+)
MSATDAVTGAEELGSIRADGEDDSTDATPAGWPGAPVPKQPTPPAVQRLHLESDGAAVDGAPAHAVVDGVDGDGDAAASGKSRGSSASAPSEDSADAEDGTVQPPLPPLMLDSADNDADDAVGGKSIDDHKKGAAIQCESSRLVPSHDGVTTGVPAPVVNGAMEEECAAERLGGVSAVVDVVDVVDDRASVTTRCDDDVGGGAAMSPPPRDGALEVTPVDLRQANALAGEGRPSMDSESTSPSKSDLPPIARAPSRASSLSPHPVLPGISSADYPTSALAPHPAEGGESTARLSEDEVETSYVGGKQEVAQYFREHGVVKLFKEMATTMLLNSSEDPYDIMLERLSRKEPWDHL